MNKPLQINKLLGGSPHARLLSRARALLQLESRLHALLPAPLTEHCRILSIRDTTLVLAADSPVWAARLRFHTPLLLKQLARIQAVRLRRVRIRVRPPEAATAPQCCGYRSTATGRTNCIGPRAENCTIEACQPENNPLSLAARRIQAGSRSADRNGLQE